MTSCLPGRLLFCMRLAVGKSSRLTSSWAVTSFRPASCGAVGTASGFADANGATGLLPFLSLCFGKSFVLHECAFLHPCFYFRAVPTPSPCVYRSRHARCSFTTSRNGECRDEVVGMVVRSYDTSTQRAHSDMRLDGLQQAAVSPVSSPGIRDTSYTL
jgi:hypothetical protein